MSNEEEYRQIMQRLLEKREFEAGDAEWENTRSYLHAQEKKKRRGILLWFVSVGFFLTGLVSYLVLDNSNVLPKKVMNVKTAQNKGNVNPGKGDAVTGKTVNGATNSEADSAYLQRRKTNSHPSAEKLKTEAVEKLASTPEKKVILAKKTNNWGSTVKDNPKSSLSNYDARRMGNDKVSLKKHDKKDQSSASLNEKDKTPVNKGSEGVMGAADQKPFAIQEDRPVVLPAIPGSPTIAVFQPEGDFRKQPQQNIASDSALSRPFEKKEPMRLAAVVPTVVSLPDSSRPELPPPPFLALEAGLGYFPDWKGGRLAESRFLQPVLGLSFNKHLGNKLLFSIGACYNRLSDLERSTVSQRLTSYSYGEESSVKEITPLRMHYITLPLRLGWELKPSHSILAGVNFSYLFAVDARVVRYEEKNGIISDKSNYMAGGYTEGFSQFDPQLSLLYRGRLRSYLYLQSEFVFGLRDLKQNGFFNLERDERSTGLRLGVVYILSNFGK